MVNGKEILKNFTYILNSLSLRLCPLERIQLVGHVARKSVSA